MKTEYIFVKNVEGRWNLGTRRKIATNESLTFM